MIINLDKDFQPLGKGEIDFEKSLFPSKAEVHFKIKNYEDIFIGNTEEKVLITTRIKSSDDLMFLLMATDTIRRSFDGKIGVLMTYFPYARDDRQMTPCEPFSLKVITSIINNQKYDMVIMFDVHSDVATALIDNSYSVTNHQFVESIVKNDSDYLIVSPDTGAYKKIFKLCQHLKYEDEIIMCNKIRDVSNGVIRSVTVSHDDLRGKNCYIIDDICDGGGTFILLAEELRKRNAGKIYLIVSHGIFSTGIDALHNIDHIYTTNSFSDLEPHKKLTQIKLNHGLLS